MLGMAITFAILALLAGILGFVALAGSLATIAKVLLFVFLALFVISLIFGRGRGQLSDARRWARPTCSRPTTKPEPWWAWSQSTESSSPFRMRSPESEPPGQRFARPNPAVEMRPMNLFGRLRVPCGPPESHGIFEEFWG